MVFDTKEKKIVQEVLIDKLIQMGLAAIAFPALSCLPMCLDLRERLPSIYSFDDNHEQYLALSISKALWYLFYYLNINS